MHNLQVSQQDSMVSWWVYDFPYSFIFVGLHGNPLTVSGISLLVDMHGLSSDWSFMDNNRLSANIC